APKTEAKDAVKTETKQADKSADKQVEAPKTEAKDAVKTETKQADKSADKQVEAPKTEAKDAAKTETKQADKSADKQVEAPKTETKQVNSKNVASNATKKVSTKSVAQKNNVAKSNANTTFKMQTPKSFKPTAFAAPVAVTYAAPAASSYNYSAQQTANARYLYKYFLGHGWTPNAIAGMLGNMVVESYLLPDINEIGGGGGYGLVQWTPASNLINWAKANGYDYRTLEGQAARIQYEMTHGIQFYPSAYSSMTASQYMKSTKSPFELAMIFMNNYERPYDTYQPNRGNIATYWYNFLTNDKAANSSQTKKQSKPAPKKQSKPAPKKQTTPSKPAQQNKQAKPAPKKQTTPSKPVQQNKQVKPAPKKQTTPSKPVQQKQVKPAPKKQTTPVKPVQQKQVKPAPKKQTTPVKAAGNQVVLASLAKPVQQEQVKPADFKAEQVQATAVKPVDSNVQTSTTPKFMKVNATVASQPEVVTNEAADFNTVNQAAVQTSALPLNSSISYSYTDQQIANAQFIYNYFLSLGWTPNAIAGLLANMMAASYLNPVFTDGVGYGLLQWTSTDDLIAWTQAKGYDYQTLSGQCAYIQHMMTTKVTSFENENEKMSSVDYTESKQSPAELAVIFRNNYDGLKSTDDAQLSADADYWYQLFAI
ncbi:hypothetical protein JK159_07335, partial [Weissella minor]|uniref:phage tail tip lysozyme n=1 Tax=Weissella minor TaxID=1620 RepID=UPI001BC4A918